MPSDTPKIYTPYKTVAEDLNLESLAAKLLEENSDLVDEILGSICAEIDYVTSRLENWETFSPLVSEHGSLIVAKLLAKKLDRDV